jgi:O-antigen/teichoic acid export membrane protein
MAISGHWRTALSSGLSMLGRACTGAIPLVLTALASRYAGLATGGTVASLLAMAYLAAELADFQAQRDIARSADGEGTGRAFAYRVSVFALVFPAAVLAALMVATLETVLAFVSAGIWTVVVNTYSGSALRRGDFTSLAVGPAVGFVTTATLAILLPRTGLGVLGYAVALHGGRAAELLVMIARTGLIRPARFSWGTEWARTRDLLFGSIASTVVGRGLTPAVHLLVGPVAAGVFAVSTQLLGAFALLPLSIATTAFHQARGSATPAEAMERMRASLRFALATSAMVLAPAIAIAVWAAHRFLDYDEPWMLWTVGLVLGSAIVEPWVVFSTAALQVAFRDRALLMANGAGALMLAVLTPLFAWALGPIGLGIGLALTRVLIVPLVWMPKLAAESARAH